MAPLKGWLSKRTVADDVDIEIARARALLPPLCLKLDMGGSLAARTHGEGVEDVARALATSLGADVTGVLSAGGLNAEHVAAAAKDIAAAQERCRQYRSAETEKARRLARKLDFGCMVFSHLYRMRLHALIGEDARRSEAAAIADGYANLTLTIYASMGGGGRR